MPAGVGVAEGRSGSAVAVGSTRLPTVVGAAACVEMVTGVGLVNAEDKAVWVIEMILVVPPAFVATGNGATAGVVGEATGLFDFDRVHAERVKINSIARTNIANFFITKIPPKKHFQLCFHKKDDEKAFFIKVRNSHQKLSYQQVIVARIIPD